MDYFNNDQDIRRVLMQLINGEYAPDDPERFRDIYDSLLNTNSSDRADITSSWQTSSLTQKLRRE